MGGAKHFDFTFQHTSLVFNPFPSVLLFLEAEEQRSSEGGVGEEWGRVVLLLWARGGLVTDMEEVGPETPRSNSRDREVKGVSKITQTNLSV